MKRVYNYQLLYPKNKKNGNIVIDVALNNYLEFYHEWDNTTFKKRDMHPELSNYLDLCSEDIPIRKKIEIQFSVDTDIVVKEREEQIRTSYYNYYKSLTRLEKRNVFRQVRLSILIFLFALMLIFVYLYLQTKTHPDTIVAQVLLESIQIGGWVFAWEAIHMIFIDILNPFRRHKELKRFLNAPVVFRYK